MSDHVQFDVHVSMPEQWVPVFLAMLRTMQVCGSIGASRLLAFYADGDGDCDPRFTWNTEIAPAKVEEARRETVVDYWFDRG